MIFRPELIEKILAGEKTQTRRPVKGEAGRRGQCRYRPGRRYGVQPGRGEKSTCQIGVWHVRQEMLGKISEADAREEGFENSAYFFRYWHGLYGAVHLEQKVWVIRFFLVEGA